MLFYFEKNYDCFVRTLVTSSDAHFHKSNYNSSTWIPRGNYGLPYKSLCSWRRIVFSVEVSMIYLLGENCYDLLVITSLFRAIFKIECTLINQKPLSIYETIKAIYCQYYTVIMSIRKCSSKECIYFLVKFCDIFCIVTEPEKKMWHLAVYC